MEVKKRWKNDIFPNLSCEKPPKKVNNNSPHGSFRRLATGSHGDNMFDGAWYANYFLRLYLFVVNSCGNTENTVKTAFKTFALRNQTSKFHEETFEIHVSKNIS